MWALDADPLFRSSFLSVTLLEGSPDLSRLRRRVKAAALSIPRMHSRVVRRLTDLGPRWQPLESEVDLDYHLTVDARGVSSRRHLLDYAAALANEPLDRERPLWQLTVLTGLPDGQAALLTRMHHVLADGIGAVRISAAFLDTDPEGTAIPPPAGPGKAAQASAGPGKAAQASAAPGEAAQASAPAASAPRLPSLLAQGARVVTGGARVLTGGARVVANAPRVVTGGARVVAGAPRLVGDALQTARSIARQTAVLHGARSPLWAGRHSEERRFEAVSAQLEGIRKTASALGGTVNDALVCAISGAVGDYHRARDAVVPELRMSMPVSTRTDREAAGNSWAPARVLVPITETDPERRFAAVHERLSALKKEPALPLAGMVAGVLRGLPPPLMHSLARQQAATVDFACSNVRGAPFELWIAGARVLANYPMGPTAGTAFNATLLSYCGSMDIGINTDPAAVDDSEELARRIEEHLDLLASLG